MVVKEKDVKKYSAILLIIILAVLSFIIVRPILLSIVAGLILGYIFLPIYRIVFKLFRERTTSALAVCVLVVMLIFVPLWFLIPIIIRQMFDAFNLFQSFDIGTFIRQLFPTSSVQLQTDITATIISFIGKITTGSLSGLTNLILDLPNVLLHATVVLFVFFFTIRDSDKIKQYLVDLSPLRKEKSAVLAKQFKNITNSIIFGNFIVGIVQGLVAGLGFLIFGVPKALLLTFVAIFAAILPVVGPWLVWVPAAIYLFTIGDTGSAIGFTIYSVAVVSTVDNFLRPYLIARKTKSSSVIVLIGMIGGLLVFGVLGLLLGPLILEYLVLFLDAYRTKSLSDLFEPSD